MATCTGLLGVQNILSLFLMVINSGFSGKLRARSINICFNKWTSYGVPLAHLRSSSRSHSVWCLTCNLLSCSPWVCFSSWVTRTWRRDRQVQNRGESGLNSDSSARNWCWSSWIFSLPLLSGARSCPRWILIGCRSWRQVSLWCQQGNYKKKKNPCWF